VSRAPIVGEPVPDMLQRPKCPNCGERLRPTLRDNYATAERPRMAYRNVEVEPGKFRMQEMPTGDVDVVTLGGAASREWTGRYRAYGAFCTLRCAEAFANAAYKAGYRIKGSK